MNRKIDRSLVDTGCGYDLVSREHTAASKRWVRKAVNPRTFQTANGITTTDKVVRMTVDEFGEEAIHPRFNSPGSVCGIQMYEPGVLVYLA